MAVPKKRTGASAQAKRRANWKATKPATTTCPKCGAIALAHTVCTECGYYKGKPASIKHEDYGKVVEEVKPTKKATTAKKSAKKAETAEVKTEEVKAEKTVVEEAKAEETAPETTEETKDAE